jgi:glycosyltransferase involved in cell wall biosynthesis
MPGIMAAADLHIVSLRESPLSLITMPSKIQSTLACGKPFIAILNGDARDSAVESGSAFPALPGNPESVAEAIRTALLMDRQKLAMMGRRGMGHYRDNFAVELGVDKIEDLLVSAAHRI